MVVLGGVSNCSFEVSVAAEAGGALPATSKAVHAVVLEAMQQVCGQKVELRAQAIGTWWRRWNPPLIAGDVLTLVFLVVQAVQIFVPGVGVVNLGFGIAAGVVNLGVGAYCLYESNQAFKEGDKKRGLRLLSDFGALMGLGSMMILGSLAMKIPALSRIGAIVSQPWITALFFMWLTLPVAYEILRDGWASYQLSQKLDLDKLEQCFKGETAGPFGLQEFMQQHEWYQQFCAQAKRETHEQFQQWLQIEVAGEREREICAIASTHFGQQMETLQQTVQIDAALAIFQLTVKLHEIQKQVQDIADCDGLMCQFTSKAKKEMLQQIQATRQALAEWNSALKVRFFQQAMYMGGFCASMAALRAQRGVAHRWNMIALVGAAIANAVALGMDAHRDERWRFKGNTPPFVAPVPRAVG